MQTAVNQTIQFNACREDPLFLAHIEAALDRAKAETLAILQGTTQPQGITLLPLGAALSTKFSDSSVALAFETRHENGASTWLQREYQPRNQGRNGIWYGDETRRDGTGRRWKASLPDHIIDDFGSLVPVGA